MRPTEILIKHVLCETPSRPDVFHESDNGNRIFRARALLNSPRMTAQCIFDQAFFAVFGVPPTPLDIREMYNNHELKGDEGVLESLESWKLNLSLYVISQTILRTAGQAKMQDEAQKLALAITDPNESLARSCVVRRWSYRIGQNLDFSAKLVDLVALVEGLEVGDLDSRDQVEKANPFTGMHVQFPKGLMSELEMLRFSITRDIYFQAQRLGPCVVVDMRDFRDSLDKRDVGDSLVKSLVRDVGDSRDSPDIIEDISLVVDSLLETSSPQRPYVVLLGSLENSEYIKRVAKCKMWEVVFLNDREYFNIPPIFPKCVRFISRLLQRPLSLARSLDYSYAISRSVDKNLPFKTWITLDDLVEKDFKVAMEKSLYCVPNTRNPESRRWTRDLSKKVLKNLLECADNAHLKGASVFHEYVVRKLGGLGESSLGSLGESSLGESSLGGLGESRLKRSIVAIDNRKNPLTVFSVLLALKNVDKWAVDLFTVPASEEYYREALGPNVRIHTDTPHICKPKFSIEDYNSLLKDPWIWERLIDYEHVLLVQDDGILARKGLDSSKDLFGFDYVGAPWVDVPMNATLKAGTRGNLNGNGGLSLRKTSAMLEIAKTKKHLPFWSRVQTEPEDVFFATACSDRGTLSTFDSAKFFSSEEILSESLGFHKPWPYHQFYIFVEFFASLL